MFGLKNTDFADYYFYGISVFKNKCKHNFFFVGLNNFSNRKAFKSFYCFYFCIGKEKQSKTLY